MFILVHIRENDFSGGGKSLKKDMGTYESVLCGDGAQRVEILGIEWRVS